MYKHHGEQWPQVEPITGREVCHACWNYDHQHCGRMYDEFSRIQCDHYRSGQGRATPRCDCVFECDCMHRSEQAYADQERAQRLANAREQRRLMRSLRDDEVNPLRALNPEYQPPLRGHKPQA